MRKDAVQARATILALGFELDGEDSHGHPMFRHPANGAVVKLSLSPSDTNASVTAVRNAHRAVGLPPPRAATKRRSKVVRDEEWRARYNRDAEARAAHSARRDRDTRAATARVQADRAVEDLTRQIRGMTAGLRDCRTPQEHAALAATIIPLVARRRALLT